MKILSIDPGIINLSLCIINDDDNDHDDNDEYYDNETSNNTNEDTIYNREARKSNIIYWDCISLITSFSNSNNKCEGINKNKSPCKLNGKYKQTIDENDTFFCKKHSTKKSKLIKNRKVKDITYRELTESVIETCNNIKKENENIDHIVIENQRKSTEKIKFTADCLYCHLFFLYPNSNVIFLHGRYKLKVYKGEKNWKDCEEPKERYKKNKFLSRKHCENLLTGKDLIFFNSFKKKDDLADCFLMCMYMSNKIIQ